MIERTDKIYMEIEEFEEYELTSCVGYEIAMRLYTENYRYIDDFVKKYKESFEYYVNDDADEEYNEHNKILPIKKRELIDDLENLISRLCFGNEAYYVDVALLLQREIDARYINHNLRFEEIFKKYINQFEKDEKEITNEHARLSTGSSFNENVLYYNYKKNGYKLSGYINVDKNIMFNDDGKLNSLDVIKKKLKNGSCDNIYNPSLKITPNFKRPFLNEMDTSLTIDLSLPENELIAYIKLLKNAYNNGKDMPQRPLQMILDNDDVKEISTPQNRACKWADMFFIYDAIKSGMKRGEVKNKLDYYYNDYPEKVAKQSEWGIDPKTINQYYKNMKNYIGGARRTTRAF